MTKLMDDVMEKVRSLPDDTQDDIARLLLSIVVDEEAADDFDPEGLDPAQEELLRKRLAEADRREFATAEEIEAVFAKFRT